MDQIQRHFPGLKVDTSDLGILDLPDTVILKIFANLSHPELCRIAIVCKHWLWIVYDSALWEHLDLQQFHKVDEDCIVNLIQTRLSPLLKTLNLAKCSITPMLFNELTENCKQLSTLSLQGCSWDVAKEEQDLLELSIPDKLTRLDIRNVGEYGSFIHLIFNAPDLSMLECFGFGNGSCHYCPTFLDVSSLFSKMSNLRVLECIDSECISDTTLGVIAENLPCLQSLNLKKCYKITGSSLSILMARAFCLKSLLLAGTSVNDESLAAVSWKDSNIEELDLSLCDRITSDGLRSILPHLPYLQFLCLNNCGRGKAVTNEVMIDVSNRGLWTDLITLSFQFCCRLTGESLVVLSKCQNLERLSFRSCHRFGFSEVSASLRYFHKLKSLEVGTLFCSPERSSCWDQLLTSISDNCPLLEKLVLLKCSGTTLGNLRRFRSKIFEFLVKCKKLTNVCLLHCDAAFVNLFLECASSMLSERHIEITTSSLEDPIIPPFRHSLDAYMKERGPLL